MREDIVDVTLLIALMRAHLPISASLERWVLEDLATNDPALGPELSMSRQIIDVSYLGDFGGIACKLDIDARTPTGKRKGGEPIYASLTGLKVDPRTPIFRQIRRYQKWRLKGLRRGLYDL